LGVDLFFEGSEKKIEVVVAREKIEGQCLRLLGDSFWGKIVEDCNAQILSKISNDSVTAYLLSESSLFVWDDRFVMITCGTTVLVNSIMSFLKKFDTSIIESLIFQRKNEYFSHLQKTSFLDDIDNLQKMIKGKSYRFGDLDGHHNYLFHIDRPFKPAKEDKTSELLMYHIKGEAKEVFSSQRQTLETIRNFFNFEELLPGFIIDDYLFDPFGYSVNAIKDSYYATFHITPEADTSYVSFETNLNNDEDPENRKLLGKVIEMFKPTTFDIVSFNSDDNSDVQSSSCHQLVNQIKDILDIGYHVNFCHFIEKQNKVGKAVVI
jgi:S-adenosylmethionine decarboxylase